MDQEDQENIEKTLVTKTGTHWEIGSYIIEKECCGRIISIRPVGSTMDRNGKFRNYEVKFADGQIFVGGMHEDDYSILTEKVEEREKITIAISETCHLVLDEIKGRVC